MNKAIFILFFLLIGPLWAQKSSLDFKGVQRSLINWKTVHPYHWLDLGIWKEDLKEREANPSWESLIKNRMLKEKIGKVIQCVGKCLNYRGKAFNQLKYNSILREGDEIQTDSESYLWIFLFDGTLVRLSPSSSISFKEINVGIDEFFLNARVNYGNILWLSRDTRLYEENNLRETDSLFLPLDFLEANPKSKMVKIKEDQLEKYLEIDKSNLEHAKKLNRLILENNLFVLDKPTYSFIVMPNGSIFGKSLKLEIVVLDGGASFLKKRSDEQLKLVAGQIEEEDNAHNFPASFYYRGFENRDVSELEEGFWYQVGYDGTNLARSAQKNGPEYAMGEYITSKITSILVARELLLREFSHKLFSHSIDVNDFAANYGYRLWGSLTKTPKEDLRKRFDFVKEYTRRVETTNLLEREKFKQRQSLRGLDYVTEPFSNRFYIRALKDYYFNRLRLTRVKDDREVLNSTSHPFWIRVRHK
ncbi:MAG: hypothetical protein OEY33_00335 [Bdellovibrionales bacterium]|nr:hypothetical protein [Bdellovibrionales bacterium]